MSHPERCRGCRGAGYVPGPKITETVNGRPHHYATVKPCEHDHWNDDTAWDEHRDKPLAETDLRATAARDEGIARGRHDLWVLSGGQLGQQHPNDPARQQQEF